MAQSRRSWQWKDAAATSVGGVASDLGIGESRPVRWSISSCVPAMRAARRTRPIAGARWSPSPSAARRFWASCGTASAWRCASGWRNSVTTIAPCSARPVCLGGSAAADRGAAVTSLADRILHHHGQPRVEYKWVVLSNTTLAFLMAMINASSPAHRPAGDLPRHPPRPLDPGNFVYLLWMLMATASSAPLSSSRWAGSATCSAACACTTPPHHLHAGVGGARGDLGLGPQRRPRDHHLPMVQAVGGAMVMGNSAAILTDAFPHDERGMALGINMVAGLSGSFIGLILAGVLAPSTGAGCSSSTCLSASSRRCGRAHVAGAGRAASGTHRLAR